MKKQAICLFTALVVILGGWGTAVAANLTPAQLLTIHQEYVDQAASEMEKATQTGNSSDYYFTSFDLMGMLSAVEAAALINPTQADAELQQVIHYCDNMIATAVSATASDWQGNAKTHKVWKPLINNRPDELDSFQGSEPIARAAAVIMKNPAFRAKYQAKAASYVAFVDDSIIQRWYVEMHNSKILWLNEDVANWGEWPLWNDKSWLLGDIASSLYQASPKPVYQDIVMRISNAFRAKLEAYKTGYSWDSGKIPLGSDTTSGGKATSNDVGNIEGWWDTAHSNRAPVMVVFQYEAGLGGWTSNDVMRFANTLSDTIWNQSTTDPVMANYINGSNKNYRTHFVAGENGFLFAGWAILGSYSSKAHMAALSLLQAIRDGVSNGSVVGNSGYYYKLVGLSGHVLRGAVVNSGIAGTVLFQDKFNYASGLVTNEYAYSHPDDPTCLKNANWTVTSGSLFSDGSSGWTGVPDAVGPNVASTNGNNSAVFRMKTNRMDFKNVDVSLSLLNQGFTSSSKTPSTSNDGVHIFLRYLSESQVYYASINRRDNNVIIKKKVPGGTTNSGTYYDLSKPVVYTAPLNTWQKVRATVNNNDDGSVTIQLFSNGRLLVTAIDKGAGGPPINVPGGVGIRTDNTNVKFKDFVVRSMDASGLDNPGLAGAVDAEPMKVYPSPWRVDRHLGQPITFEHVEAGSSVKIFTVAGEWVASVPSNGNSVAWNLTNDSGNQVASGIYLYLANSGTGEKKKGMLQVIR